MTTFHIRKFDGSSPQNNIFLKYVEESYYEYYGRPYPTIQCDFFTSENQLTIHEDYGVVRCLKNTYPYSYIDAETFKNSSDLEQSIIPSENQFFNLDKKCVFVMKFLNDQRPLGAFRNVDWRNSGVGDSYNSIRDCAIDTIMTHKNTTNDPWNYYMKYWDNINLVIFYSQKLIDAPLGHDYLHSIPIFYNGNDPNADEIIEV